MPGPHRLLALLVAPLLGLSVTASLAVPPALADPAPAGPESETRPTLVPEPAVVPAPEELGSEEAASGDLTAQIAARLTARQGMTGLGPGFSGRVTDAATNRTQWSLRATTTRLPASTLKLVTGYVAVRSIGADTRFGTPVQQDPTYGSTIYLRGVGDPRLTAAAVNRLAVTTARTLKGRGLAAVNLKVDDTLFPPPTNAGGWKPSYLPDDVAPVRALVVNSRDVWDTSMDAASIFAGYLRANGLAVRSIERKAVPKGAPTLAVTYSSPVSTIVGSMLNASQNDYAEILLRVAALRRGRPATWAGATSNAAAVLVENQVSTYSLVIRDGSGLSRYDRMPTATLTSLLHRIAGDPVMSAVFLPSSALPEAGRTGTLRERYVTSPTSCAAERIHAKTGTLADVVTLAGYAEGVDGSVRTFAFLIGGVTSRKASVKAVDIMATTATGCF